MSAAEQSKVNARRTGVAKNAREGESPTNKGGSTASSSKRPVCEKCGHVHTKCNGHTRHGPNTGKPCGANPPRGQFVCIKHGGNHPAHKKAARERLMEMVEPAITELSRILNKPGTSDADRLKAIRMLFDRTGYVPGVNIALSAETEWDKGIREATVVRDLDAGGEQAELEQRAYDALQLARDQSEDAWAASGYDAEDAPPDHPYADEHTVRGEVLSHDDSLFPDPHPTPKGGSEYDRSPYRSTPRRRPPDAPPRYVDTEAREAGASGD